MQTEERMTCPSCGGDNPRAAAFCWRCYTSFSAPGPVQVQPTGRSVARPVARVGAPRMPDPPVTPAASGGPHSSCVSSSERWCRWWWRSGFGPC